MTLYDLDIEKRLEITGRIQMIIGKKEDWITPNMDTGDRIKARMDYDKLFEKLAKIWVKYGDKALAMAFTDHGGYKVGVTPNGKKWTLDMNGGWTTRSRHCGTLRIDGECIYTSGTLAKAFEYILEN